MGTWRGGLFLGPDLRGDLVAIELGQGHVEQDQVGRLGPPQPEPFGAVGGDDDVVPLLLERVLQESLDVLVVVDDEDLGRHRSSADVVGRNGRRPGTPGAAIIVRRPGCSPVRAAFSDRPVAALALCAALPAGAPGAPGRSRAGFRPRGRRGIDPTHDRLDVVHGTVRASRVNSIGMTNFVDGLAPSALSASRYCSAIVFWSIPRAAWKIRVQRLAEALRAKDRRLALALRLEDLGLLLALGDVDRGLAGALGFGDDRAPCALGREHPVHRVLDVARRDDLADLDRS